MIILDTCTIREMKPRSGPMDLLRTIRASGIERVAAPWVAIEELAAQKAITYLSAWEGAVGALEALAKASPWDVPAVGAADPEGVREHWRKVYGDLLEVLPASQAVMQQALIREANALPPCKHKVDGKGIKKEKIGGRDAAIWLTAIEYAREHPDETVYFVSGNHRDFGDGESGYEYPMDQDLDGIEEHFVHLTKVDDLVARFAQPVEVDRGRVQASLAKAAGYVLAGFVEGLDAEGSAFECTWADSEGNHVGWATHWLDTEGAEARHTSLSDVTAYRMADHTWVMADATWELSGFVLVDGNQLAHAVSSYATRVLLVFEDADPDWEGQVEVIRAEEPRAVDYDLKSRSEPKRVDAESLRRAATEASRIVTEEETDLATKLTRIIERASGNSARPPQQSRRGGRPMDSVWPVLNVAEARS
ncbi:PIN domain-containing protein [Streptomyces lavendulae]|uniref:PIN domain-containing protein n=1 Tax=Streptomyces lavendulae TaxID=1914 RepID=UPI0038108385